jgi:hypothetical protein
MYKLVFQTPTPLEVETKGLLESVDIINRYIKSNSILSFPVNRNIVANWTSRSKSKKYNFVDIKKM